MPDRRRHRGQHPSDADLFGAEWLGPLREAVADLAWLLGRGYGETAALKLVGDRRQLRTRQRMAVWRSTCTDEQRDARAARQTAPEALSGAELVVDGYNVLITVEAALAGGVLIKGRDGCVRDIASLHGHFKRVVETEPALMLLGAAIESWQVATCEILLDAPVSNSGRLAGIIRAVAAAAGWPFAVRLVPSADPELKRAAAVVASADSVVLDACGPWFNLAATVVEEHVPDAYLLDLGA